MMSANLMKDLWHGIVYDTDDVPTLITKVDDAIKAAREVVKVFHECDDSLMEELAAAIKKLDQALNEA